MRLAEPFCPECGCAPSCATIRTPGRLYFEGVTAVCADELDTSVKYDVPGVVEPGDTESFDDEYWIYDDENRVIELWCSRAACGNYWTSLYEE